jgi:adenylate kinase
MNIIILGPQGSGKGTQAEKLAERFNLEHIDMGKFLREVALLNTPLGIKIHETINVRKELVDEEVLREVIHLKLVGLPREQGIVFDGVPRSQKQLEYLEEVIKEVGRKIDAVILITLSEKESLKRIAKRRVCEKCKAVYILGKDKDASDKICRQCGGKVDVRIDDTPDGVRKRLNIFERETMPIVDFYKNRGMVLKINGDQTIEEVFEEIVKKLKDALQMSFPRKRESSVKTK